MNNVFKSYLENVKKPWGFNQMQIHTEARILELGCGTGELWRYV
ncbi:hypothetical protein [Clostridium estertheticum]|nr:hypothetical protein [Clostridium estertheticum]